MVVMATRPKQERGGERHFENGCHGYEPEARKGGRNETLTLATNLKQRYEPLLSSRPVENAKNHAPIEAETGVIGHICKFSQ